MVNDYNERLHKIEEEIAKILPAKSSGSWLEEAASLSAPEYGSRFYSSIDIMNRASLELIERGGKRWRPMLMLLLCEMRCGSMEKALPLTPLVELPHNGSLIIDDIEDNADLRRGKPAVHLVHGTDVAINSANFIYFLPSAVIDNSGFSPDVKLSLYRSYTAAMRRLHIGQGLDIAWHREHSFIPEEKEYLSMCAFKTGSLSRLAAEAGLLASEGEVKDLAAAAVVKASEEMGVGFQILDDVINLRRGNPGKKRGDDIVEGKKSLPVILFSRDRGDTKALAACFEEAKKAGIEEGGGAVEKAIEMLEEKGSIEKAKLKALEILENSRKALIENSKKSRAGELISFIFDSFTGII